MFCVPPELSLSRILLKLIEVTQSQQQSRVHTIQAEKYFGYQNTCYLQFFKGDSERK